MSVTVLLETERLRLETWGDDGAEEVFGLHADPRVNTYLFSYGEDWTRRMAADRVAGWLREFRQFGLGKHRLVRRSDGTFVGRAGFTPGPESLPEISYSLAAAHWGQGYAGEIAAALRDWFFATHTDRGFIGFAHIDNRASRRILEKIGMKPTHVGSIAKIPHQFYELSRASYPRPVEAAALSTASESEARS